jgi:hypothetical protein
MIILKKKYLELCQLRRNLNPVKDIKPEDIVEELNRSLDILNKISELSKYASNDEINFIDYEDYLNFLYQENYEELKKYKII